MFGEFSFPGVAAVDGDGVARFDKSDGLPRFYSRPRKNEAKSRDAGAPIFDAADFVEIVFPGERDTVDRPVSDHDKQRWRDQWNAYQEGREQAPEGVPLAVLFPQNPELVETLRASRFHTVEQLAAANDTALQSIAMGAYEFQKKAKAFLEATKDGARWAKIEKSIEDQAFRIKQLEEENAALRAHQAKPRKAGASAD